MTAPRIGVPRVYAGAQIPILYPGEVAHATHVIWTEEPGRFVVSDWVVEPAPGWWNWWLRVRYRIWGRWWGFGAPKIETSIRSLRRPPEHGE